MLKKLRLDQTKIYEKYLALEEISIMLLNFVEGRSSNLSIGAEQGDIDKWDDLVIETNSNSYIYVQAKRQSTDFSTDSIIRDAYIQGKRKGNLRDLSPFDKTIKSLGEYVNNNIHSKNKFILELPEGFIQIKEGLEIRHLKDFCQCQIRSVTTIEDLEHLQKKDKIVNNIFDWLTTWCDFRDWGNILEALKILEIRNSGFECDIENRVDNNLSRIFKSTEISTVKKLIFSYLDEKSTYAGAIKPRQLLFLLNKYLESNIRRWTLFKNNDSYWSISGIIDLEDNNNIERAEIIVPEFWSLHSNYSRNLKIDGKCEDNCSISESLMRLCIHPQGSFDIMCTNRENVKNFIVRKTGGTLGVSKNDIDSLTILGGIDSYSQGEARELNTISENESFAEILHTEMNKYTFSLINSKMIGKIKKMTKGDLRNEVEIRWGEWKKALESDVDEQKKLFSKILHPNAEGKAIIGELRVGTKTVDLLCDAIFLLLIVSVCISDDDNKTWKAVSKKLKMTSIGLSYWSGPSRGLNEIIRIDDDDGISNLIESELGEIIIISQSELSENEIIQDDIAGEIIKSDLLTHPKYPKLLITYDRSLKRKIKRGSISEIKEYFNGKIDKYKSVIDNAVNMVVDERLTI
ncbi:ABC-three component system protein [uncultured Clostridium sp.]|jgi:hypothetical protein|uniref:ABC-three component system protein n=1 Tax=uncultured Clostridium sp. TaxID=59620 RepID=UPI0025CF7DA2|nr:ABC-three component system protein [uncultured Clostridium sp.]